jgi:hypothetical protein
MNRIESSLGDTFVCVNMTTSIVIISQIGYCTTVCTVRPESEVNDLEMGKSSFASNCRKSSSFFHLARSSASIFFPSNFDNFLSSSTYKAKNHALEIPGLRVNCAASPGSNCLVGSSLENGKDSRPPNILSNGHCLSLFD